VAARSSAARRSALERGKSWMGAVERGSDMWGWLNNTPQEKALIQILFHLKPLRAAGTSMQRPYNGQAHVYSESAEGSLRRARVPALRPAAQRIHLSYRSGLGGHLH